MRALGVWAAIDLTANPNIWAHFFPFSKWHWLVAGKTGLHGAHPAKRFLPFVYLPKTFGDTYVSFLFALIQSFTDYRQTF
jgi:hypothetical protein